MKLSVLALKNDFWGSPHLVGDLDQSSADRIQLASGHEVAVIQHPASSHRLADEDADHSISKDLVSWNGIYRGFRCIAKIFERFSNQNTHFDVPQSQSCTAPVPGYENTTSYFSTVNYYRRDTIRFRSASCAALKQSRSFSRSSTVNDVAFFSRRSAA